MVRKNMSENKDAAYREVEELHKEWDKEIAEETTPKSSKSKKKGETQ